MAASSSLPRSKNGSRSCGAPRPCRAFRARTSNHVRRALADWGYVFGRPVPTFSPTGDCQSIAAQVKKLLGACPSDDPREVMAWQSIKKSLPASCSCMTKPLMEKLVEGFARPRRELPAGYLRFIQQQTRRLFPKGWDLGYEEQVLLTSPPLSSTIESPRSKGGCLGTEIDHDSFLTEALRGVSRPDRPRPEAEVIVVQSAGKPRPLTKFGADELLLRPLHKTIYNHLSKCRWLARGDVTDEMLSKAGFNDDGILTSGDYASATDNLSIEVAEVMVEAMMSTSSIVPQAVRSRASEILRPFLYWLEDDGHGGKERHDVGVPRIGQMMGSYLSFPLLCMQNRMAFIWSLRLSGLSWKEVVRTPCLINGDDILFQSSSEVSERWMSTVGGLGLEVERTKTSVDVEYGSLNSTLLRRVGGYLRVVPTLRFGRLRESEFVTSLGREFSLFLAGVSSNIRFRAGVVWFRKKIGSLRSTRLTLHELGFRGTLALRLGRLFKLACWAREEIIPPPAPVGHNVILHPEDFVRVPESETTEEVRRISALEGASWKFQLEWKWTRDKDVLRYCLALSSVRRTEPRCGEVQTLSFAASQWQGGRLTNERGRRRALEEQAFRQKRVVGERTIAVPVRVLDLQDTMIRDNEFPPAYSATGQSARRDSVVGPVQTGAKPKEKE
nr:MAG: RNA-dependent RNA polymerase [Botourmiaviridae sp.]